MAKTDEKIISTGGKGQKIDPHKLYFQQTTTKGHWEKEVLFNKIPVNKSDIHKERIKVNPNQHFTILPNYFGKSNYFEKINDMQASNKTNNKKN